MDINLKYSPFNIPKSLANFVKTWQLLAAKQLSSNIKKYMVSASQSERGTKNPKKGPGTLRSFGQPDGLLKSFEVGSTFNIFKQKVSENLFEFSIGSKLPYASVHEFGNASKNIPARPYLEPAIKDFEQNQLPTLLDRVMDDLLKQINSK